MITAVTLCVPPTARASRHPRPHHGRLPCHPGPDGQRRKEERQRHANPKPLTSRITAPPVRPRARFRTMLRTGLAAQAL